MDALPGKLGILDDEGNQASESEIRRRATWFQYGPFDSVSFKTNFERFKTPKFAKVFDQMGALAGGFASPRYLPKTYAGGLVSLAFGLAIVYMALGAVWELFMTQARILVPLGPAVYNLDFVCDADMNSCNYDVDTGSWISPGNVWLDIPALDFDIEQRI